jgi:hypothetical protein
MTVLVDEPCAGCGAPLGADQRYCLSCGIPRAGTRLPFLDVLHSEAASAGVIEHGSQPAALLRMPALGAGRRFGVPQPSGWWDGEGGLAARLRENSGLFALLGVLLLALLIGLLLGHWVGGSPQNIASVPTKQVIEVKGLPAAAVPAAGVAGSSASAAAAEPTASSPAGESTHTAPARHASNPTVSSLAKSTGKEHARAVEKALGNSKEGSLSTGGAPPPTETSKSGSSKPIGGGSEVTSIE